MDNLRPIISGLIGGLAAILLLAWALRASPPQQDGEIRYGSRMRLLALFCLALALFIGYAALHARADQRSIAYGVSGVLLSSVAWFVLEVLFVRVRITESHLEVRSPWRRRRVIPWTAITGYEFSEINRWHILSTKGFGKVRLSCYLSGVDQIAAHLDAGSGPAAQ